LMRSKIRKILAVVVIIGFVFFPIAIASTDSVPEQSAAPEDVPKLDPSLPDVETEEQEETNHAPTLTVTADPGWNVIAGTKTVTSPAGQKVSALIWAYGHDEDGDPLEYTFENYVTKNVVGPGKENWIAVSSSMSPGRYPGRVIVTDTKSGKTAEKEFVVTVLKADDDEAAGQTDSSNADESGSAGKVEDNKDLINCLCRCLEPKGGQFQCRYNTTDKGSSPSCADFDNGPCICQGTVGCFRGPLPTEGECYDRCVETYGTTSEKDTSPKPASSPSSPGDPGAPTTVGFILEQEPNDLIGDANEIKFASPAFVKGQITPAGDVDFYKFYVDTSGILQVKLDDVPNDMRSRIELYGKNFNWIARKDASNTGDAVILQKDISGPGWHYFAISDLERKAHTEEYSFEANFEPAEDPNEPNNVVGDATEIEFGQTQQGYICPVDDADFYKFHVETSGMLQVKLDDVPSEMRSRIELYGKNFNWIARKDASNAGDTITFEKDILGPGWHYFAISDLDRKAHSIAYSFDPIFNSAPDANEPNNVVGDATQIEFGQAVQGYICPVGDVDFYMLYVDTSGILQVEMDSVSSDMRSRIELYGKNFNWIARKDASNAGDVITFEKDVSGPGWHYIAISDLDRKAHYEGYSFVATLKSG
jgi:hypothetical protein